MTTALHDRAVQRVMTVAVDLHAPDADADEIYAAHLASLERADLVRVAMTACAMVPVDGLTTAEATWWATRHRVTPNAPIRVRPPAPPRCGTERGMRAHRRAGQQPCAACTAWRERRNAQRRAHEQRARTKAAA